VAAYGLAAFRFHGLVADPGDSECYGYHVYWIIGASWFIAAIAVFAGCAFAVARRPRRDGAALLVAGLLLIVAPLPAIAATDQLGVCTRGD
jgi:hypothetical protein